MHTASKLISTNSKVRKLSKRVVEHAMEGDGDSKEETENVQKMSAADFGEYVSSTTGKMIDVTGLADKEGMIDFSDAGVERVMAMMASRGVSNVVHKGTAKEALIRKRLQQKLLLRKERPPTETVEVAAAVRHESDKERAKRTREEVNQLMKKNNF